MSDEKLSGGGRPESRERQLREIAMDNQLNIGASRTIRSIDPLPNATKALNEAYELGERDMAERAAQRDEEVRVILKIALANLAACLRIFDEWILDPPGAHGRTLLENIRLIERALAGVPAEPGA